MFHRMFVAFMISICFSFRQEAGTPAKRREREREGIKRGRERQTDRQTERCSEGIRRHH